MEDKLNISPWIIKFNKGKRRASSIFQVNKRDFAKFVKQILDILCADIRGEISNIDPTLIS